MSWSISIAGAPDAVVKKLNDQTYTDENSQKEYDAVKEHLVALVERNTLPNVQVTANGSSNWQEGEERNSECSILIRQWI